MPLLLGDHIDFGKLQALNLVVQNLGSAPGSPVNGQIYYDNTLGFGVYHNGSWVYPNEGSGGTPNAVTRAANAGASGELMVSAGADKTAQSFVNNGILKNSSGVVAVATAGTDYSVPNGAETLTNKTIDANGTGNSISNLEVADFASGVVDNDSNLAAASSTKIPTQQAVKAYVDNKLTGLLEYKGGIDASTNPNYPAASKGDYYKITVAGKIGGASGANVQVGDAIIANADNVGGTHAAVGSSWDIVQGNAEQATTSALGLVILATQAETEAKTDSAKVVTPSGLSGFVQKKLFTFGDGAALTYALTHNLNTQDIDVIIRDASTNEVIITKWIANTVNQVTVYFAVAPTSNSRKAVVIG